MKPWLSRPREIRNLFNPAFCSVILMRGIEGFEAEAKRPMPFSLILLILPLCLHKKTRMLLKVNNKSYLAKIIENYPEILVGLAMRTKGLYPYALEALGFLFALEAIEIFEDGSIGTKANGIKKTIQGSDETRDCQMVARSLGKKYAIINDRITIYTSLGVRP